MPDAEFDCDLVIIGAGLAGLSLVCWLLELSRQTGQSLPTVQLLEPRTDYSNDRTWCFWDTEPNPFSHLISHRWSHWQVNKDRQVVSQFSEQAPYVMLPSGDLYQYALACIESCPEFSLQQGTSVVGIVESAESVLISTSTQRLRARAVVDTRPPEMGRINERTGFWQVFSGYEIHCPGHGYDTQRARLMDFQPCEGHVRFVYLLPLDQDNLLAEWTEFHPGGQLPDCTAKLEEWLARRGLRYCEVKRTESAALPMMPLSSESQQGRLIRAGVGAGWMRAATGYHFATCQRASAVLAAKIFEAAASDNWSLGPPTVRKPWLDWMDKVFLRALHRYPEAAPEWFLALFRATSAQQMARFMNDEPRWCDAVTIANALPKWPFLRAIFS